MTTTNPVPSNDPTDLLFNAQKLDQVVNGSAQYYTDRLGVNRRTMEGISAAADVVLGGIGYAPPVAYASGISLTLTTQTVEYAGEVYAPKLANIPFTTSTWATDSEKFRLIQGVASTDLSASGGSAMIGYMPAGTGAVSTDVEDALRNLDAKQVVENHDWSPAKIISWERVARLSTPTDIQLSGSATASVDANGDLNCKALYTDSSQGIRIPMQFSEGRITFTIKRAATWMLGFRTKRNGSGWRVWSADGVNYEVGYVHNYGETATNIVQAQALPGTSSDYVNIEVEVGPAAFGLGVNMRSWMVGGKRPDAEYSGSFPVESATLSHYNEGFVCVESFGSDTTILKSIKVEDGQISPIAMSQAAFTGAWFTRYEGRKVCMATVRQGSSFRCQVKGTDKLTGGFVLSLSTTQYPILSVYVNGVFSSYVEINTSVVDLITGLNQSQSYDIECKISGIHEHDDKWIKGAGLLVHRLYAYNGTIKPMSDDRPGMMFIGDSITEGVASKGTPGVSIPQNSCGEVTWGRLTAERLGFMPIMGGFGGTGLTVVGSGGVPDARTHAFYHMKDREINLSPRVIVVNLGTNDSGQGVSSATFQTALASFVESLRVKYSPSRIYLMRPFNGVYASQISAVANAQTSHVCPVVYVDTTGWLVSGDFNDGTHPTVAGHTKAANLLVPVIYENLTSVDLQ